MQQTIWTSRRAPFSSKNSARTWSRSTFGFLWTDYFKPPHFEKYPNLNELFNQATKLAGAGGTKGTVDVAVADQLLTKIDEISEIFWETQEGLAHTHSVASCPWVSIWKSMGNLHVDANSTLPRDHEQLVS